MPDDNSAAEARRRRIFELFNEIGILAQLSRTIFEQRLPRGLSLPQFSVLNHLVRLGDGRTPLAIARAFQVPKTSMTHTLATLEGAGLVEMRPNPDDGRSKLVHLTDAGRAVREDAILAVGIDIDALDLPLGNAELETLLPRLQRLRAALDKARD